MMMMMMMSNSTMDLSKILFAAMNFVPGKHDFKLSQSAW